MTARLLVGDVHERVRDIPDDDIDFLITSPPFLALRSYLPDALLALERVGMFLDIDYGTREAMS